MCRGFLGTGRKISGGNYCLVGGENSIGECCEEARNSFAIPLEKSGNPNFSEL